MWKVYRILALGLALTLQAATAEPAQFVATVCLDAGHGGEDSGARGGKLLEKDLSLAICLRLKAELEGRGYRVFLTRAGDFAVPVEDRTGVANHRRAAAFVSIHADSSFAEGAGGPRIYCFAEPAARVRQPGVLASAAWGQVSATVRSEGLRLARSIAAGLEGAGQPAAALREAPLLLLAGARMPAVVVEVGVLPHEAQKLSRPQTQDRLAGAIAQGIDLFFRPQGAAGSPREGP